MLEKNFKSAKNTRDVSSYSKTYKFNCSCPNDIQFKKNQSKSDDQSQNNENSWVKATKESEKFLQHELKKYGLAPKAKKLAETKHYNSPRNRGRVDINLRSVPEDRIIKVNIKEILCTNKFKSKTDPNLSTDRYVEDLKKEIKSKKREIPSLPEKYKKKYLKSLKEELLLNKLTTCYDNSQQIEEIRKEIETFRSNNSQFYEPDTPSSFRKNVQPTEFKITIHNKDQKRKDYLEHGSALAEHRRKLMKGKSSEAGDGYDRICVPECDIYKNKRHKNKKKSPTRDGEDFRKKPQSSYSKEEILKCNPVKSCATISTQCDFSVNQTDTDVDIAKKLEVFEDLIPQISSVIERTEKNLEKEIQKARKSPKTVQERGVSPIKDILGTPPMARNQFEEKDQYTPQTPPNSPIHSVVDPISTQSKSYSPHIGNLLVNIQNIKDSRCLLNSFQNELIQLKTDIQNCSNCDEANENKGENNYCDKHIVYIPLLKMGEVGSKSDQIKLFNTLKTEVYLKKELENQIKHISKLERNLSRAKKLHEADKVKSIENELELAKSYFNNLLVKQQNERLLSEQQKIMSDNTTHKCENIETCGKCSLERQIHDLLEKVRMNIAQEIENSKQRLKIQRMPAIDIRNPLQLQNIFKLDIPPSKHPQAPKKSNFVYESVVKDDIAGDLNTNEEATQTKIVLSKSTSVELSTIIKKNKELEADIHKSSFKVRDDGEKKKDNIMKSHFTLTPSKHSLRTHKERSMNMEKTPSELGFRQNISTQCDSNTSFVDSGVLPCSPPKMTTHTQTVYSGNDSSYLFGFKEYLMKKTGDSFVLNPFSTNFQGSLDESNGSVVEFRTIGVNTEPSRTKVTKNRSCEFHGVTVVGSINEDIQEDEVSDISGDETEIVADPSRSYQDTIGEFQLISKTSSKSLKRIPSLKKMFLAPQKTSDAPHTDMEATIHNPYGEPKYRIKRFSTNRRESDSERKPQHDDYYKSLIEKEELPERKAAVLVDSPPVESRMSDEQSKIGETKNSDNLDVVEQDLSENKSKAGDVSPASYRDRRLESNKHLSDVFTEIITKLPSKRLTIPERLYEYMEDVEISHQGGRKNQNESSLITTNEEQNKVSTEEEEKAEEEEEVEEEKEEVREEEKEEEREEKQEEEGEEKQEEEREEEKDSSNRVEIIKAVTEEIELGSNPALQDSQYDDRTNTEEAENIEKPLDETQIIITQQPNDKNYGMPTSTVLTMLPTKYEFSLDKSRKYKIKLSDHNILLRLPESTKSFKRIEPSSKNTYMQSDEIILTEPNNSTRKISASYNNDGFIMTNSPQSKRDKTSITNYILHKPPVKNDISCRYRSDLSNLTKERLEYSRKCSKMVDSSSLASSEGEVICKCKNISVGEIHSCPQGGNDLQSDHSGIEYKENLSSHIVLENQRKHYQHWVTYYTKKKYGHDSSSSSIEEK